MKDINIENFKGIEVEIDYKPILDKYGEKCKDIIVQNSPKKSGRYRDGWRATADTDYLGNYSVTVWNETDWQLTHLLENGHAIVNKKGGTGWASAKPHIKKGYRAVKNAFEQDINNVKLTIK